MLVASETLPSDALTLTVKGKGFDATLAAGNVGTHALAPVAKMVGNAGETFLTELTMLFTHVSPTNVNNKGIQAVVTVSGTWSSELRTVAMISAVTPTVLVAS